MPYHVRARGETASQKGRIAMWSWRRIPSIIAVVLLALSASAYADDDDWWFQGPQVSGPIYDITHFDVIPLTLPGTPPVDFLQNGYSALFTYRDASQHDAGLTSFKVVNLLFPEENHSEIVDVWNSYEAFAQHLAQPHSVDFRFTVMGAYGNCCIGSPIDDRQYHLVQAFNEPWTSQSIPATVGSGGALYVITYADFLQEGNVEQGEGELLQYGNTSANANRGHLLSFSVLQQLGRPNRLATLEVWDTQTNYNNWQTNAATTKFVTKVTPLLGSPFDHRPTILCGETYVDNTGCTPP
jgi:quinol monooxygenase YgiN